HANPLPPWASLPSSRKMLSTWKTSKITCCREEPSSSPRDRLTSRALEFEFPVFQPARRDFDPEGGLRRVGVRRRHSLADVGRYHHPVKPGDGALAVGRGGDPERAVLVGLAGPCRSVRALGRVRHQLDRDPRQRLVAQRGPTLYRDQPD